MSVEIKFSLILTCFIISLVSSSRFLKRQAAFLKLALLFTVISDFFLLLADQKVLGVACFCIVQILYILRYNGKLRIVLAVSAAIFFLTSFLNLEILYRVTSVYAVLFFSGLIYVTKQLEDPLIPILNRVLSSVGMYLFVMCDICVALYNLPLKFISPHSDKMLFLIWVFYLPSQFMLSLSSADFTKIAAGLK